MDFQQFLVAGVFVESLVKIVNMAKEKYKDWRYWASLIVGILVAVAFGVDAFEAAGLETTIPYIGAVLTGVIISRGANVVHDIIKLVQGSAARLTPEKPASA
jgi:hypothetical protein